MARYRPLCCELLSVCIAAAILFSSFTSVDSQQSSENSIVGNAEDSLNITGLPPSVAQIVEAISNVQKNVSKTASKSKAPNIKVAGLTKNNDFRRNLTATSVTNPKLELQLYETEDSLTPERLDEKNEQNSATDDKSSSPATTTQKTVNSNVKVRGTTERTSTPSQTTSEEEKKPSISDQEAEAAAGETTVATLDPPAAGLLSFDGVRQWFNWVWSMRDPNFHPEGPLSWPTIIGRGLSTIIRYYNPLRRIFGRRSLTYPVSIKTLSKEHPHYDEILKAVENKEISGDSKSINSFVHKLERKKIAEKISAMSYTHENATGKQDEEAVVDEGAVVGEDPEPIISLRPLAAPIANAIQTIRNFTESIENAIFAPFDVVPTHVHTAADLFDHPFDTVIRVPFYIKYANLALKALYILIPLIYIPLYSGVENFFLAPLPPDMDTLPGMLRFFGLQAMLGPDYVYDYSEDEEEAEGDDATSAEADEDYDYDYEDEDDVRRNRRKDDLSENKKPKKRRRLKKKQSQEKETTSEKKKETRYTNLAPEMRPPPSRYSGQSSYSTIIGTQDMQPVYIYPVSESDHSPFLHSRAVQAPAMHEYRHQWPNFHLPPSLPNAQIVSPPFVIDPSASASPSTAQVLSAVSHSSQEKPVVAEPLEAGAHTFGTPLASNGPSLSVPIPLPSFHGGLVSGSSSNPETLPSEILYDDRAGVSHYQQPASYKPQSTRPLFQGSSNDALFSQVDEIRENFLIAPNYSGMTTQLVSQSQTEVPYLSTSTTPATQAQATKSALEPVYVTAPTIIRTSTVFNRFPSTATLAL